MTRRRYTYRRRQQYRQPNYGRRLKRSAAEIFGVLSLVAVAVVTIAVMFWILGAI